MTSEPARDICIQKIKEYLALKAEWQKHQPTDYIQDLQYEGFQGHRGKSVKQAKQRISMGILKDGEGEAIEEKGKGDAAFRSGNYDDAETHYRASLQKWGHPQNAVCYSNLSATLLKLEKWSEAEAAAQSALREHYSVHGYYHGIFHIKVFHRLGLANTGLERYEVAGQYFGRALRINQNNAAVKVDMEKALQKLRSSGNADALMRSWKGRLGLTEHEIDCLVEAGAKPWDENVQDLLEVSGLREDTLKPIKNLPQEDLSEKWAPYWERADDSALRQVCGWCTRPPISGPFIACRGCGMDAYCSERCQILHWKGHAGMCASNREMAGNLVKGRLADSRMYKRMQGFVEKHNQDLALAALAVMGCFDEGGDTTAFERYCAILHVDYELDPNKPLWFLEFEKVSIEEAMRRHPKSLSEVESRRKPMHDLQKSRGNLGTGVCILLVRDEDWESAAVHTFTLFDGMFDEESLVRQRAYFGKPDWKERFLAWAWAQDKKNVESQE